MKFMGFGTVGTRLHAIRWLRKNEGSVARLRETMKLARAFGDYGSSSEHLRYSRFTWLVDDEHGWADWSLDISTERIGITLAEGRGITQPDRIFRFEELERIEYVRGTATGHTVLGHDKTWHIGSRKIELEYLGLRIIPRENNPIDVAERTSYSTTDHVCGTCRQTAQKVTSASREAVLWDVLTSSTVALVENPSLAARFSEHWRKPWVT
jgi:hypothetical protein